MTIAVCCIFIYIESQIFNAVTFYNKNKEGVIWHKTQNLDPLNFQMYRPFERSSMRQQTLFSIRVVSQVTPLTYMTRVDPMETSWDILF